MLPHAVASRSSDSWSHDLERGQRGGAAAARPRRSSWRVRGDELVAGHRSAGLARPRIIASRSARARSVHGPGRPSPIGAPSNRVTGRTPATLDDRNASSAAARSARVSAPSTGRSPTRAPQPSSHERVVPGRIAQSSDGVASSATPSAPPRTRKMLAVVALGQVAVDGQEQRVVGAGPARLEPRVDVVGARRRLERRQRVGRIAPDRRRDQVQAALEVVRPAAATTGQAWIDDRRPRRPRPAAAAPRAAERRRARR